MDIGIERAYLKSKRTTAEAETTCERKGVWAGLMNEDGDIVASAVNGPVGRYQCKGKDAIASCGCAHAEAKLFLNAVTMPYALCATDPPQLVLYCVYSPCLFCTNLIVLSKMVKKVVYLILTEYDQEKQFEQILFANGIEVAYVGD